MSRYPDGLSDEARERRRARRDRILDYFGANASDWTDWHWQVRHVIKTSDILEKLVTLDARTLASVRSAVEARLPFGVTPYYLSLMDEDPEAGRDRAGRAGAGAPSGHVRSGDGSLLMASAGSPSTSCSNTTLPRSIW